MNYLPICTFRLVVQYLYQISIKSMQGCRLSWEDKLWCDGRTEGRNDGRTEWRKDGMTDKANTKCPLAIFGGGIKNQQAPYIYGSVCERKYDVTTCADDVIDGAVKIKDDTTLCRCKKQWKIRRYLVVKPRSSKSEVNGIKHIVSVSYAFNTYPGHQKIPKQRDVFHHLGFLNFFAYWRSIREEVYSVTYRLHVTGFYPIIFWHSSPRQNK